MSTVLNHTGVTRAQYKSLRQKLTNSMSNRVVTLLQNITIPYDSTTKQYTVTDTSITEDSHCTVYFNDVQLADGCMVTINQTIDGLVFTFGSEPTGAIVCSIVVINR